MGALPATKTPICDIPHLVGIPAPEHLLYQAASLQRVGWWVIALFYHIPSMTSTPLAVLTRVLPPPRSPLRHGDVRAIAKWKILCYQESGRDTGRYRAAYPPVRSLRQRVGACSTTIFPPSGSTIPEGILVVS